MRNPLARLLVRSPLPRIADLMDRVIACTDEVPPMIQALIDGDQAKVVELAREISRREGAADKAKNEVRANMPIRLFLPVDRRDVLKLLSALDAIADSAEDVGVLLTMRQMEVPEEIGTLLKIFTERSVDAAHSAAKLVAMLDTLLESGFTGRPADQAKALIDEIGRKEHETDKLQDQLAKMVFTLEDKMSPVAIFMWLKILSEIGDMSNHAENVGDQFRLFIAG